MIQRDSARPGIALRKLLVVDDEEKIRHLLSEYFALKGYEVRTACRGEDAVALTSVFSPDVVLLDLLMPGMSGTETLKALKGLAPAPRVLMISAADHDEVVQEMLRQGADFYVCKPLNLAQLEHLVKGILPANGRH